MTDLRGNNSRAARYVSSYPCRPRILVAVVLIADVVPDAAAAAMWADP